MFRSKAVALENVCSIVVTLAVFHEPMLALKAVALANMFHMVVTRVVFHEPMFALKAVAHANMSAMLVTDATFHLLMSALNVGLLAKTDAMLVTAAVSQSAMLPYVAAAVVGLVIHAVAAVARLPSTRHASEQLAPHVLLHVGYAARSVAPQSR
jgi:hypothetical protein